MTDHTRVTIGRTMAGLAALFAILGFSWLIALGYREPLWEDWVFHNGLVALGNGVIVWLVIKSQPRNAAIWVLAWAGLLTGLEVLGYAIAAQWADSLGITTPVLDLVPSDVPLGMALVLMQINWLWMGVLATLAVLPLFPDGRPASPRWRWLPPTMLTVIGLTMLGLFWEARPSSTNTLRATQDTHGGFSSVTATLVTIGYPLTFLLGLVAIGALVGRYRRSVGEERQQFRWVVWGTSVMAVLMLAAMLVDELGDRVDISLFLGALAIVTLLGSIGIAIGKYRLYDIDVVISRTVVLGILAAFITAVYAVVVVGVGAVIGGSAEGLFLPIAATAIVALAFEPVRNRAQKWANRLVYGRRATPYEVLAELTAQLSHGEAGEGLLERMAKRVADGTGAERATIWLGETPDRMSVGASWPVSPPTDHRLAEFSDGVFPVTHDGELAGVFEVVKTRGSALSTAETALIEDLAGSAGAVLGYQRLNDSLAEKATELARSRARLVDAQDQERRRLERDLHDGAQQLIVALKLKIGLARTMAARGEAPDLVALLSGLEDEAQKALEEVRSLAKGIYPPVLESDGLGPAVSALASGAASEVVVEHHGLGRYDRDIEAAVYFEISEAVTNAVKHASGPIVVSMAGDAASLRFSVSDSGPGFDPNKANGGSGLQNLRDRMDALGGDLEIESSPSTGTTIRGEVPLVIASL